MSACCRYWPSNMARWRSNMRAARRCNSSIEGRLERAHFWFAMAVLLDDIAAHRLDPTPPSPSTEWHPETHRPRRLRRGRRAVQTLPRELLRGIRECRSIRLLKAFLDQMAPQPAPQMWEMRAAAGARGVCRADGCGRPQGCADRQDREPHHAGAGRRNRIPHLYAGGERRRVAAGAGVLSWRRLGDRRSRHP